jgi:hypothetical protein
MHHDSGIHQMPHVAVQHASFDCRAPTRKHVRTVTAGQYTGDQRDTHAFKNIFPTSALPAQDRNDTNRQRRLLATRQAASHVDCACTGRAKSNDCFHICCLFQRWIVSLQTAVASHVMKPRCANELNASCSPVLKHRSETMSDTNQFTRKATRHYSDQHHGWPSRAQPLKSILCRMVSLGAKQVAITPHHGHIKGTSCQATVRACI